MKNQFQKNELADFSQLNDLKHAFSAPSDKKKDKKKKKIQKKFKVKRK